MKFMYSRWAGYAVLFVVYALATAVGVTLYAALPLPVWAALLIADVLSTIVVFLFSLTFSNASVYDPYWSVQPAVILSVCVIGCGVTPTTGVLYAVVLFWAVRLTANWAYTFRGLAFQDWRYTMLAEKTGKGYFFVNFTGIHLVPTLVVYGCTMSAVNTFLVAPNVNIGSIVCFLISLGAAIWQGVADCTLHAFKKRGGKGFLRRGVWKYSRHPNYLGEILMWWGIAAGSIFADPASFWWLPLGAIANTLLFLFVSIPLADGRQARKKGFEVYHAQTRMLLPIPRFRKGR